MITLTAVVEMVEPFRHRGSARRNPRHPAVERAAWGKVKEDGGEGYRARRDAL
jgi:hypothetical protein